MARLQLEHLQQTPCYDATAAPVTAWVPLVAGEIGENDCGSGMLTTVMNWLDLHRAGYLAWAWNTWGIDFSRPALITEYAGTATPYGKAYKDHLASAGTPPPAPPPAPGSDFALSAPPDSFTLLAGGGTAVYTLTLTTTGGFNGSADQSVSGLPDGSTASISPATLTSGQSILSVGVPCHLHRGAYMLTATGSSGALTTTIALKPWKISAPMAFKFI